MDPPPRISSLSQQGRGRGDATRGERSSTVRKIDLQTYHCGPTTTIGKGESSTQPSQVTPSIKEVIARDPISFCKK